MRHDIHSPDVVAESGILAVCALGLATAYFAIAVGLARILTALLPQAGSVSLSPF